MDSFGNAYTAALACTPGAANQCQQPAPAIGGCNCDAPVEDATQLDAIAVQLRALGCIPNQAAECPCPFLGNPTCVTADAGGGMCQAVFPRN